MDEGLVAYERHWWVYIEQQLLIGVVNMFNQLDRGSEVSVIYSIALDPNFVTLSILYRAYIDRSSLICSDLEQSC